MFGMLGEKNGLEATVNRMAADYLVGGKKIRKITKDFTVPIDDLEPTQKLFVTYEVAEINEIQGWLNKLGFDSLRQTLNRMDPALPIYIVRTVKGFNKQFASCEEVVALEAFLEAEITKEMADLEAA